MTKQITLEEALKLVSFYHGYAGEWEVLSVHGDVKGNVYGKVGGDVDCGIGGDVHGNVEGDVEGTINGREWEFVETPKEKLQRLIEESGNQELIDTFNQLEDNS
tara:strand:- start:317 stop:628 length:312 start_codon:yes stop_codon:yes gene_type:complete